MRNGQEMHPKARATWNLILEHQNDRRMLAWDDGWYDLKDRLEKEGWTPSVIREFATSTRPKLVCTSPMGIAASRPPSQSWDDVDLRSITSIEVKFPDRHGEDVDIPDEALLDVVSVLQANLLQASGMFKELQVQYFRTPTCYPDREVDGSVRHRDFVADISWFVELFKRLPMAYVARNTSSHKRFFGCFLKFGAHDRKRSPFEPNMCGEFQDTAGFQAFVGRRSTSKTATVCGVQATCQDRDSTARKSKSHINDDGSVFLCCT